MMIPSYIFKLKAKQALRGNWQTPLLITFFAGALLTALSVMQAISFPDVYTYLSYGDIKGLYAKLLEVPQSTWIGYYALAAVAFAVTPVLTLGANHYFICRIKGEELGFKGLLSRLPHTIKALGLFAFIYLRVFLWSLLLFVPGILAALRYSMAPYFLAENPDMGINEAIEKSKKVMDGNKMTYFMLELSFIGLYFVSLLLETLLISLSTVVALVLSQFMRLFISTYLNASIAAMYMTVSREGGLSEALQGFRERMREMGANDETLDSMDKAMEEAKRAEEEMDRAAADDGAEDAYGEGAEDYNDEAYDTDDESGNAADDGAGNAADNESGNVAGNAAGNAADDDDDNRGDKR